MNYGIRISKQGVDVKTGADKDMVFTSKYPVLKGSISGEGSIVVTVDAGYAVVTIPHGLGYAPVPKAYAHEEGFDYYGEMPVSDYIEVTEYDSYSINWDIESDNTNVYLKFKYETIFGDIGFTTMRIYYAYSINIDKANLQ